MKKYKISVLLLGLLVFPFIASKEARAECYNNTQDNLPNALVDGDIDHYDINCFEDIPDDWISAAKNLNLLFVDRSVGGNINDGLDCIASGIPYDHEDTPNSCRSGLDTTTYVSDTKYDRSNWDFAHYGDGGWYDNVENFILNQGLRSADGVSWTPNYSNYDVMNFQFSYLSVMPGGDISSDSGYFAPHPGSVSRIRDVHDMEEFESSWPQITFVQATTSLARSIGGQNSYDFNNQMRNYTENSDHFLIDFADIGSHDSNGNECLDSEGYPVLCEEYTSEVNGGHLAYGLSKQMMAKVMWVAMAGVAGWEPGATTAPPSPTPTIIPTSSPTSVPTSTPTLTPVQGDANGDGVVDGLDYVIWLNNYNNSAENGTSDGDFNNDSTVDGLDYVIWLNNYEG